MTNRPDDPETPIERDDAPDAADVPQADPSGRVDEEDQDRVAGEERTQSPLGGENTDSAT